MKKSLLTSYGAISKNFRDFSKISLLKENISRYPSKKNRRDCFEVNEEIRKIIEGFFEEMEEVRHLSIEVFKPSINYPPHQDGGGLSYFVPMERGTFKINGEEYLVNPFTLYSFEDSMTHNTDFCSIMIK